jgi:hypothetical protein
MAPPNLKLSVTPTSMPSALHVTASHNRSSLAGRKAAENSQPQTVPLVDFGKFLNGSQTDKKQVSGEIDSAFRNVGFVYLQNHGVSQERVEKCFDWVSTALDSSVPEPWI